MERVEPAASGRTEWGIMVTLALSMLASLGTSIANIALPTLAGAFAAPFGQVQGVVVAYLATLTASVVVVGRLGDRHGLTRMLLLGLGVFAAASLLCGVAPTLWVLIGARALQGIGAAFLMTLSMALMRETAGEARVGRAMGLLGTVSALGTALGPALGGVLIPLAGWRAVFLVQVPLAVVALVLAVTMLPRGTGKGDATRLRLREMLDRRVAPNLLTNVLVAAVMMTTLVVGPFYLGTGLGLTEAMVGFVMAVGPAISIVSGVPSGRLVDGWGSRRVMAAGLALLAAGAFLMAILPGVAGVAGYVLAIAVLTTGYQLFQAANNTAALADVSKDRRGSLSGFLGLSRNIGLIAGASVMGAVFALGAGTTDVGHADPAAVGAGMRLAFLTAGGLMIAAFLVAFGTLFGRVARA